MISEHAFPPLNKGLVIPDAGADMPPGSLGIATNADTTDAGLVRQRFGTTLASSTHATVQYGFVHHGATPQYVILLADGTGRYYTASGTSLTSSNTVTGGPTSASGSAQMLRSPLTTSAPDTYVSSAGNTLYRYDGTNFSAVANSPKCRFVSQAGFTDRLACFGFTAGANGPTGDANVDNSIVWFSDAASPEAYTAGTRTVIAPGKGGDVMGGVSFDNQLFVFKEDRFFVVYAETASGGAVDFLYNERTGVGMASQGAVCATDAGVFFLAKDGIYLTTGGSARRVSDDVGGLFTGELPSWSPYARLLPAPATPGVKLTAAAGVLYAAVGNVSVGGTARMDTILAYDWRRDAWSYYAYETAFIDAIAWPNLTQPLLIGAGHDATNYKALTFHPAVTTDAGAVMPMMAQLHWLKPEAQRYNGTVGIDAASILRAECWGSGRFTLGVATDYDNAVNGANDLNFGNVAQDTWGSGAPQTWGSGSASDTWGTYADTNDLLRLQPPVQKHVYNPQGRGNVLALRFTKTSDSGYAYFAAPKVTVIGR